MKKKKPLPTTKEEFIAYQRKFVIATLRRGSLYWPYRSLCLTKARSSRGQYLCAKCQVIFPKKEVSVDHIIPIVALTGFTTWDDYFNRLFCNSDNLQVLCKKCHQDKTTEEGIIRKINRKMNKNKV